MVQTSLGEVKGWEYLAVIGAVAGAGLGEYSADAATGWHLNGSQWAGPAIPTGLAASSQTIPRGKAQVGRAHERGIGW
jgi:hypothetical protein